MNKLALAFLLISSPVVQAQQIAYGGEILARVNGEIITSADYSVFMADYKERLASPSHRGANKTTYTSAELDNDTGESGASEPIKLELLDRMIDDLLLEQRAKDLGFFKEFDFDAVKTDPLLLIPRAYRDAYDQEDFEEALSVRGLPDEQSEAIMRKRFLQQYVVQKEILAPIFDRIEDNDRHTYYKTHKAEFTIPVEVTLSELFLPCEKDTETEVAAWASHLLAELRAGADFDEVARENQLLSCASGVKDGRMGRFKFKIDDLKESVAMAISTLKSGEYTEPIQNSEGIAIFRLDERRPATLRKYNDPEVQLDISRAIARLRAKDARRDYISALRKRAAIEIYSPK